MATTHVGIPASTTELDSVEELKTSRHTFRAEKKGKNATIFVGPISDEIVRQMPESSTLFVRYGFRDMVQDWWARITQ